MPIVALFSPSRTGCKEDFRRRSAVAGFGSIFDIMRSAELRRREAVGKAKGAEGNIGVTGKAKVTSLSHGRGGRSAIVI